MSNRKDKRWENNRLFNMPEEGNKEIDIFEVPGNRVFVT